MDTVIHRRRGLRGLVTVMLSALLLSGLSIVLAPAPPASADCPLFKPTTADAEARMVPCGPGGVAAFGPRIGLPRPGASGGGMVGPSYGSIVALTGVAASAVALEAVQELVEAYNVPWPKKTKKRGDILYRVYQVWFIGSKNCKQEPGAGKRDAWKYGITMKRQGERRPKIGVRNCRNDDRTRAGSCEWKWARTNVKGFYRARRIEAMYAASYKRKRGRCPIGMTKCI